MKKQRTRRHPRSTARGPAACPTFTPAPVRHRHDGWTADRQVAFLAALGESGCVEAAAHAAGMSPRSAYKLKARADAHSFREAWDIALDVAVSRIGDALVSRALHGEVTPIYFRGEQVGERRRFDNRLAMWLVRLRRPERFGDRRSAGQASSAAPADAAELMRQAIGRVAVDGRARERGETPPRRAPLGSQTVADGGMPPIKPGEWARLGQETDEALRRLLGLYEQQGGDTSLDDAAGTS